MTTSGCGASADPQDGLAAPPAHSLPASHCARCRKPAVLAARGTTHCRDCFLSSLTNRFTKAIQPARTAAATPGGVLAYQTAALSATPPSTASARDPARKKKKPRLVVACSGGPASTALVHLVHQSLFAPPSSNDSRGNRYSQFLPFDGCEVIFVDQSAAVPGHPSEDRTEQVRKLVASIAPEFEFTALRLEDVFRPPHSNSDSNSVCGVSTSVADLPYSSVSSSVTPRERLVALLSPSSSSSSPSSFSPTSRASLTRSLLNTLLISHVAQSGSEFLLLGDTGTRSAIRTLAGMSEGRGYSIGEEVALERIVRVPASSFSGDDEMVGDEDEDKVNKGDKVVMVLRPLGQTVDKEIAFYNRECALDGARGSGDADGAVDVAVVPEVSAKTRSIPSLVEDFIRTLDADFPSTVPTVVRTAHKLGLRSSHAAFQELASAASSTTSFTNSPPSSTATRETNCPLCGLPAQTRADEWRKAITISDLQAVLAADPRGATPSTTTLGRVGKGTGARAAGEEKFVKRREPYQPSQAHLLVKPGTGGDGDGDEAATTTTTIVKEEVQEENAVAVPSSLPLPSPPTPTTTAVDETDSLARYLCYGCLLVLSEPASASAQRANKNKTKIQNGPAAAAVDVILPGYVNEASILGEFSIAEQKARIELAAAYRMFAHMNWNEGILNHITVAIKEPDGSQAFLINPYGLRYDEVTASSLLKINLEGEILHAGVIGDIFGVNRAGFVIHGAIHRARGESATAIAHNHVPSITGLACTKTGFLSTLSQTSELCGESGSNKFEGLVTEEAMQKQLVQDLGDKDILVFQNHGILTAGRSVAQAWLTLYNLIRAAEIQVAAQSCGGVDGLILPSEETAHKTVNRMRTMTGMPYGEMEFAAYMRLMDKIDPSYRL
ncbi:hypothetical protein RHOSPDRAFT_32926 [Rhodotorula sp. JG-1b]|nr:hypothetical protein RHOSPDRAFT_32926 [Rhodotorula sp. JG-1b]